MGSKADFESINAAIGRMIASVPESKTMAVYDAFSALVGSDVPAYLMSTMNEADAKKAYGALMDFKDVVKANPITATVPETGDNCSRTISDVLAIRFLIQLTTSASALHDLPCLLLRDLLSTSRSTAE